MWTTCVRLENLSTWLRYHTLRTARLEEKCNFFMAMLVFLTMQMSFSLGGSYLLLCLQISKLLSKYINVSIHRLPYKHNRIVRAATPLSVTLYFYTKLILFYLVSACQSTATLSLITIYEIRDAICKKSIM